MKAREYFDALLNHFGVSSIYALSQRMGIRETTLRNWKTGGTISHEYAHMVGDILGIDPAIIMADMEAEGAQNERVRNTWAKLAESLRSHAAGVAAALLLGVGAATASPDAVAFAASAGDQCILCKVILAAVLLLTAHRQTMRRAASRPFSA